MLTWETLIKRIENERIDEDQRLIAQLLINLKLESEYLDTSMEARFEEVRQEALTNPITYYQNIIK